MFDVAMPGCCSRDYPGGGWQFLGDDYEWSDTFSSYAACADAARRAGLTPYRC